jgi:hypothetical protein
MRQDRHEEAVRRIETLLGGEVLAQTFKPYPDGYFDAPPQPQNVKGATAEPKHLEPLDLPHDLEHILDWRNNHWSGQGHNCIHCRRPTLLHDDAGRPAHKACAETALAQLLRK